LEIALPIKSHFRESRTIWRSFKIVLILFALQVVAMSSTESSAQAVAANKQYIYVLRLVPRLHDSTAWTDRDNTAVSKHFARLQEATQKGKVILAGRTEESLDKTFGIVVFEAENEENAKHFMQTDPTIVAGVMSATLHPYSVALLRK
jgi:uncharacterized protein YciI